MMTRAISAFELRDVAVEFGRTSAVCGVDLTVLHGERVAFVGPSGSGKTTLLRTLTGMLRPTRGSVAVLGQPLATCGPRTLRSLRARVGFVHQDLGLVPNLRVVSNVLMGRFGQQSWLGAARAMMRPARADVVRAHEILDRVGIGDKLYQRTDRLSGGERQRVAIARALYQRPDILLADEPVSSVDPARARDTVALLTELASERGLALCMSLHNLDLAREFFPRMVGLRDGRVQFDSPSTALDERAFADLYRLDSQPRDPHVGERSA